MGTEISLLSDLTQHAHNIPYQYILKFPFFFISNLFFYFKTFFPSKITKNIIKEKMNLIFKFAMSLFMPFTVLGVLPYFISKYAAPSILMHNLIRIPLGFSFVAVGLLCLFWTIFDFYRYGNGTLVPIAPPKNLVITGLYKYTRNPMITGALLTFLGESFLYNSLKIFYLFLFLALFNMVYLRAVEEPELVKRFGKKYEDYKNSVPMFVPSLTPYERRE